MKKINDLNYQDVQLYLILGLNLKNISFVRI